MTEVLNLVMELGKLGLRLERWLKKPRPREDVLLLMLSGRVGS